MSATPDKRIAAIREQISDERALLSDLNNRVGADLKKELLEASEFLADAERWLAPRAPLRSVGEWVSWLGRAVQCLREAFAHRKRIEARAKKFGPNARVVG
jgi:hypothetical protein